MKRHYTLPFGAGDIVRLKIDPKHAGRVRYAHSIRVRVQWIDTNWISEHDASELETTTRDN